MEHNVQALADFAILILTICADQGATERTFSDAKIKKTQHRNNLGLEKLDNMCKVRVFQVSD
jgi:hypothetical protein